ncbi:hypothetical protein JHW33_08520 [Rahnella aceris]|uniref:hypothetical protein n=1 Tax=Rahnella sp. (strain Y9602) TaxID=2703885 RepID=UPI001908C906|nr:hypothetical protein [Rahnella aceris]QQN36635.1 hypothetical protein JHW33_08520 [Rahnella aceris]
MTTPVARFPELDLVAIPETVRGRELSFSKTKNPELLKIIIIGQTYSVIFDGVMRRMVYSRSPLGNMLLFDI